MWETKHCLYMDPRRELVAMQIANTQTHNAAIAAAATATATSGGGGGVGVSEGEIDSSSGSSGNGNDLTAVGSTDTNSTVVCNGESSSTSINNENTDSDINNMDENDCTAVSTDDVRALPIASTVITAKGVFTSIHNPRGNNRINLLTPGDSSVPSLQESTMTVTVSTVSPEAVRVVGFCDVLDAWRSRVQSHAVRLMNTRGMYQNHIFLLDFYVISMLLLLLSLLLIFRA